jgi:hypothetical protein
MVTPDELRSLLKQHRWTIAISTSGRQQVYAAKQRRGKKLATRYIGTANTLNELTEEDILEKLHRNEARPEQAGTRPDARPTSNHVGAILATFVTNERTTSYGNNNVRAAGQAR